jgi:hypothetical protein
MPVFRLLATYALLTLSMTACGGGSTAPTTPAEPAGPIVVTSQSDLLFLGVTETFTASGLGATSNWVSDAVGAATAEGSTGRITGVGSGMATISVDSGGRRGSKLMRVLPNYLEPVTKPAP